MKNLILFSLIAFSLSVFSQNTSQNVISSAGDYHKDAGFSVSWTVGETAINTLKSTNIIVTQGFQQSKFTVSKIEENISNNFDVKIYPNPASDFIKVIVNTNNNIDLLVRIIDISGHTIKQTEIKDIKSNNIDIRDLSGSVYFIKVINKTDNTYNTYKLIKEK